MSKASEKINSYFKIRERNSSIKVEMIAGLTAFIVVSYVIIVNPTIISHNGQSPELASALFIATCLSSAVGCLLMGLVANLPFIQAPGMGMNGYFAFTAMPALALAVGDADMDIVTQYQMACAVVFVSGILFVILSATNLRKIILESIPKILREAMVAGLGLFITFLGVKNAGIIVHNGESGLSLVDFSDPEKGMIAVVSMMGLIVLALLAAYKVKGACIVSILSICAFSTITGNLNIVSGQENIIGDAVVNFMEISFLQLDFATMFSAINLDVVINTFVVLTISLTLTDVFDSAAAFYSVIKLSDLEDDQENKDYLKKAYICDSIGTLVGSLLGSSSITTYVESTVGVGEGGRTGLTSTTVGVLFICAIFCMPIVTMIPVYATAPTLIYAGMLFLRKIDFGGGDGGDVTELIPALLTLIVIPFSGNVTDGLAFGMISYVLLKLLRGKIQQIKLASIIISAIFIIQYFATL